MGNIIPSPEPPAEAATTAVGPWDHPNNTYKGKKYVPSEHQVDILYNKMADALKLFISLWYCMDVKVILMKLLAKIKERNPEFFAFMLEAVVATAKENDTKPEEECDVVAATPRKTKKKKRKLEGGPIIIHGRRVPREVMAHVVTFCDRSSVNNLGLTCKGLYYRVIEDRKLVKSKPWPNRCPCPRSIWSSTDYNWHIYDFIASRDLSRFAVARRLYLDDVGDEANYYVEIWDRFHGLIGEIECVSSGESPDDIAFAPDGSLLLVLSVVRREFTSYEVLVQAVQLPPVGAPAPAAGVGPIDVSEHSFNNTRAVQRDRWPNVDMAFVDNNTFAVTKSNPLWDDRENGDIAIWKIDRSDGSISLSYSRTINVNIPDVVIKNNVVSFGTFLATIPDQDVLTNRNCIIFHDLFTNESLLSPPIPGVNANYLLQCLDFTQSGKLVVSLYGTHSTLEQGSGKLFVYDFKNVNTIQAIGKPRVICPQFDGGTFTYFTFSADGEKAMAEHCSPRTDGPILVNLKTGGPPEDLSQSSAWNIFANSGLFT